MKPIWIKEVEIDSTALTNAESLVGLDAPEAVLLNWNDWGYGLFEIDQKSLTQFKEKISLIEDNLARNMIYSTVYQMVRDATLPPQFYLDMVRNHIHLEASQEVLSTQVQQ